MLNKKIKYLSNKNTKKIGILLNSLKKQALASYFLTRAFDLRLRYLADSNRRIRFCRPVPSHSAKVPFSDCKDSVFLVLCKHLCEKHKQILCSSLVHIVCFSVFTCFPTTCFCVFLQTDKIKTTI